MYEYLASVQSASNRVNDRIMTLADKFGINSAIINNISAQLDVLLPDNIRYKDGVIQVARPSEIYNDAEKMQALENIENTMPIWGNLRKHYEDEYMEYASEQGKTDKATLPEFIETMQNLDKALRDVPSDQLPSDALKIMQIKGRKKTYNELIEVTRILSEKGFI